MSKEANNHFLLVYASQTGQAKAIAEEIADSAPNYGLKANLFCMSLTDKRFCIEKETCAVFVVSTTGDGQAPDSAIKFYRRLNRHTLKKTYLENLNYALLALGDSNYIKFCLFGRLLEKKLKALSAKSFYETGYGDDAYGIETAVDPWMQNLWPALRKQLNLNSKVNSCFETTDKLLSIMNECKLMDVSSNKEFPHNCSEDCRIMCLLTSVLKEFVPETSKIPKLPPPSIIAEFQDPPFETCSKFLPCENLLTFAASSLVNTDLIFARRLTSQKNVKKTLELTFKFEKDVPYQPGDSFGFICKNSDKEVDFLLNRLNLLQHADAPTKILLHPDCTNKRKLPNHITSLLSLRDILLYCVEIRSVPKKIMLRVFAEYTKDAQEKLCLLFLSSAAGSNFYTDLIRKPSICILDILATFKSCYPPIETIIEYLPHLKPRFYSVASSPLEHPQCFRILFNVLELEKADGRVQDRHGVCTGWFYHLSTKFLTENSSTISSLTDGISSLTLDFQMPIKVYKRKNEHFHFGNNFEDPIIMVGPGTGLAPFIGFLKHRQHLKNQIKEQNFGETWLFYGCRYSDSDFLYKDELRNLVSTGVLSHLIVSFSRETFNGNKPQSFYTHDHKCRYVHENIRNHAEKINELIDIGGKIFVCGDAKFMAHDVQQAFIDVFQLCKGLREKEAESYVENLQKQYRYINDVWT